MINVKKNCMNCHYYDFDEILCDDFYTLYSDTRTCVKYCDCDECGEIIGEFNYESEKDCCVVDVLKVIESDEELSKMFDEELETTGDYENTYKKAMERYGK